MLGNAVARRYAHAFFDIAKERQALDAFEKELKLVIDTVEANADLSKFINNQLVEATAKQEVFENVFASEVSETTLDFLKVVTEKGREVFLKEIYNEFVAKANESRNILDAQVVSAKEVTAEELEQIKNKLAQSCGKTIRLETLVDPKLVGGMIVKIGNKVIDGSVNKRMEIMRKALLQQS